MATDPESCHQIVFVGRAFLSVRSFFPAYDADVIRARANDRATIRRGADDKSRVQRAEWVREAIDLKPPWLPEQEFLSLGRGEDTLVHKGCGQQFRLRGQTDSGTLTVCLGILEAHVTRGNVAAVLRPDRLDGFVNSERAIPRSFRKLVTYPVALVNPSY